jgi:hypothetical protein
MRELRSAARNLGGFELVGLASFPRLPYGSSAVSGKPYCSSASYEEVNPVSEVASLPTLNFGRASKKFSHHLAIPGLSDLDLWRLGVTMSVYFLKKFSHPFQKEETYYFGTEWRNLHL